MNGGGVTVDNVTYNNPTNLTVNLTVSPYAAPGARSITVTNPDGQSATSLSGLLTIVGGINLAPTLDSISNSNFTSILTWSSISGTTYQVQFKTNLNDAAWLDLLPTVTATGVTASATDSSATNAARFYRVLVVP